MAKVIYVFRIALLSVFIVLAACQRGTTSSSVAYDKNGGDNISLTGMEKNILYYVNQHRHEMGKADLKMIDPASDVATQHSANMAAHRTAFGHDGFENRVAAIGKQIGDVHAAAENVAYGELTAQEVVNGWLHSPGHKKNIEGDYVLTGIGVAKDKNGTIFYTQIFLRK